MLLNHQRQIQGKSETEGKAIRKKIVTSWNGFAITSAQTCVIQCCFNVTAKTVRHSTVYTQIQGRNISALMSHWILYFTLGVTIKMYNGRKNNFLQFSFHRLFLIPLQVRVQMESTRTQGHLMKREWKDNLQYPLLVDNKGRSLSSW